MAKEFFKNYPDTSTPLTAERLNGLLDGEEAMGNIVVDSLSGTIKNKAMESTNINDIKITGTYNYDNGSQGYTNSPTQDGIHILNVFNDGSFNWVVQEDYVLRWGSSTIDKYIRQYSPAGWSNWQKII